ncbi:hypothetical protein GCM10010218_39860 [Streptomyces mashuensis]|uniref:Lipoprotein n=1 Tax=Streptomyces mashuensis TaxID=33904 RepID=A0A919B537_9ACTN|nr:hypothetical protein [Streptomyces mashuensis]GHF54631.1 hypothetical protein GCM10010218_39860 [Streptomyces mashuensis]
MTTTGTTRVRHAALPLAVLALLAAGCGTHRAGEEAAAAAPSRSAAQDLPCPSESPAPPHRSTADTPPADHYAENNGFKVPLPLHGKARCEGRAAAERIKSALETLRTRGDFSPASTRSALVRLGHPADRIRVSENGTTGVAFLVDTAPLCLEGTMSPDSVSADAFAGYPDHTGCEQPRGGH